MTAFSGSTVMMKNNDPRIGAHITTSSDAIGNEYLSEHINSYKDVQSVNKALS